MPSALRALTDFSGWKKYELPRLLNETSITSRQCIPVLLKWTDYLWEIHIHAQWGLYSHLPLFLSLSVSSFRIPITSDSSPYLSLFFFFTCHFCLPLFLWVTCLSFSRVCVAVQWRFIDALLRHHYSSSFLSLFSLHHSFTPFKK